MKGLQYFYICDKVVTIESSVTVSKTKLCIIQNQTFKLQRSVIIYILSILLLSLLFTYSSKNHFPVLSSVKVLKTAQLYIPATIALINIVVSVMLT